MSHWSERVLADQLNVDAWKAARVGRIGASDAAAFAKVESADKYAIQKLSTPWIGGIMADHGHEREPHILAVHGYEQNTLMIASDIDDRFEATPDGIRGNRLAQVKTTLHGFTSKRTKSILVPANYRRQVLWEQLVMGPEFQTSDFIFEKYSMVDGQPVPDFDTFVVEIDRDEEEIRRMLVIGYEVLGIISRTQMEAWT